MSAGGLDLATLMSFLEQAIVTFPDVRTGDNTRYSIRDATLDGTWFHNSEALHRKQCNYREHREGRTTFLSHGDHPGDRKPGLKPRDLARAAVHPTAARSSEAGLRECGGQAVAEKCGAFAR